MNPTRTVSAMPDDPGSSVAKFLVALYTAHGNPFEAKRIAAEKCRSAPKVERAIDRLIEKASVGAMPLTAADPYGIGAELFTVLQSQSLLLQLLARGRRLEFRTRAAKEIGAGGAGAWKGEGLPRPVTKSTTDTLQIDPFTADFLTLLTAEVFRFGRVAEQMITTMVTNGLSRFLDGQALDPTVAATSAHPASLLHGAPSVASTGSGAAQIAADLASLIALITAPGDSLTWVLRSTTAAFINAKLASIGVAPTPGFLLGIPTLTGSGSPRQVALIDMQNVVVAYDPQMEVDLTREADVEMADAPAQSGLTGAGAAMTSLFQSNLVGVRAALTVNYQHVHFSTASPSVPIAAAVMTTSY